LPIEPGGCGRRWRGADPRYTEQRPKGGITTMAKKTAKKAAKKTAKKR
jgi:hypothetical protein